MADPTAEPEQDQTDAASADASSTDPAQAEAAGPAPDTVNDEIIKTLAVVEAGEQNLPLAGASLEQIKAQAVGLALLNAVNAQQNAYVTANATVLAAVTRILALGEPAAADRGAKTGG